MATITLDCIKTAAKADSKADAIRQAGQLLVQAGVVEPEYVPSLLAREQVADTFLGQGVAIPHGMIEDRHHIRRTGLAVLQVRDGVPWGEGQRARLVVAIAAQSDEHLDVLRRLTRLMQEPGTLDRLVTTDDPAVIAAALTGAAPAQSPAAPREEPADAEADWVLDYPNGLHARPATRWVETAKACGGGLRVRKDGTSADAGSLTELLGLGLRCGDRVTVTGRGPGAKAAVDRLLATLRALSAEEQAVADLARRNQAAARRQGPAWTPSGPARTLPGLAASPGLAVGRVLRFQRRSFDIPDQPRGALADGEALEAALEAAREALQSLETRERGRLGASEAAILASQRELLADPALIRSALARVMQGHGAAWAWNQALGAAIADLRALPDPLLAARALDLQDAGERVLAGLLGQEYSRQAPLAEPTILVAEDLTPSDTLQLDPTHVAGLAIRGGGPTSHTAILARTLGIPALVAMGPEALEVPDGAMAVLDGQSGLLYLDLGGDDLAGAGAVQRRLAAERERLRGASQLPATTTDGRTVEIAANVANPRQATLALDAGADGIGLMRTEFLFLERDHAPTEEEQFAVYADMVKTLAGRPLIVRALDIGGDKKVPYLDLPREMNPFLGVRGARLLLRRPDLLGAQLRAIYRAAALGPVWIMFPMITHLEEIRSLRAHCAEARRAVGGPEVKLGIMVEVPAVAMLADRFAAEVDFFSIGTNDLTQYALAVDRQHPELAGQADSLHPAVLLLIDRVVRAARAAGTWVGVCGGLAGDPLGARILTGLGVDELSMSAQDIPAVKAALRADSAAAMADLAARALQAGTAGDVRGLA